MVNFSVLNCHNFFACFFRSRLVNGATVEAKLRTNLLKTVPKLMKELGSVYVVGVLRTRKASVVCLATSSRSGRIA